MTAYFVRGSIILIGHRIMSYPSHIADLLNRHRLDRLTFGSPYTTAQSQLRAFTDESLVAPHPLRDREAAAACRAGLWLWFEFFEESHGISQDLGTAEGSYW